MTPIESLKMERDAAIRSREDLAAQLRVMKKRLQEAEEEQYKAEEDTATLRSELELFQRREEDRKSVESSSYQYHVLQQEVATLKADLQDALRRLKEEQQTVANEQERAAKLATEQEQLKFSLAEAQRIHEGSAILSDKIFKENSLREKDHHLRELAFMVERLESGRQKLLAEIDDQSVEIERLFMENDSLAAHVKELSTLTGQWENQVQKAFKENTDLRIELNRLRGMLAAGSEKNLGDSMDTVNADEKSKLQAEVNVAKGEAEALRAQVLQLTSDMTRALQHAGSLNWLYRPILANVENRLQQLKSLSSHNQEHILG